MSPSRRAAGSRRIAPQPARRSPALRPILVLRKAGRVLEALRSGAPQGSTFTAILAHSGLPSSTCLRLLHGLADAGFLDREGNRYRPSRLLADWAWAGGTAAGLPARATPILERLRDETGESACLFVRQGDAVPAIVALAETRHPVAYTLRIGQAMSTPLAGAAGGRIFLAYEGETARPQERRAAGGAEEARLAADLAEVRRRGFAVKHGANADSLSAISAPVFDFRGQLVGALGLVTPSHRMARRSVPAWAARVAAAARTLSALSGAELSVPGPTRDGSTGRGERRR